MYFWNIQALADELKQGTLPQRERLRYFLVFLLLDALVALIEVPHDNAFYVMEVVHTVILLAGTYLCYQANQQGDQREFIDRYICLGLPIGLRLLVLYLLALVAFFLLQKFVPLPYGEQVLGVIYDGLYFWQLRAAIWYVAGVKPELIR